MRWNTVLNCTTKITLKNQESRSFSPLIWLRKTPNSACLRAKCAVGRNHKYWYVWQTFLTSTELYNDWLLIHKLEKSNHLTEKDQLQAAACKMTYKERSTKNMRFSNCNKVLILDFHLLIIPVKCFCVFSSTSRVQRGKATTIGRNCEFNPSAWWCRHKVPCCSNLRLILKFGLAWKFSKFGWNLA